MAEVNFYLRDPKAENTTIYAYVHYNGQRVKIATGIRVEKKYWNQSKQRCREMIEFKDGKEINVTLDGIRRSIEQIYQLHRKEGVILSSNELKKQFRNYNPKLMTAKLGSGFWDYFEEFIDYKRRTLSEIKDYHYSLRKHLKKVEHKIGKDLSFPLMRSLEQNFDLDWMEYLQFDAWNSLGELGLSPNTVGKQNKNLKVFLNWCFDRNYTERFSLKRFPSISEDVEKVYLTEDDLIKLENVKLLTSEEKIVRDLFFVGCETGLRFGDFIRLKKENILSDEIHVKPGKTSKSSGKKLIIPISNRLQRILEEYSNEPPGYSKNMTTQFNKTIRSIAERAGIDDEIVNYKTISGKQVLSSTKKFEEITSHTCRRTFCTLKFLKGMPAQAIMKFSGHTTERNFLRYLKLDARMTADKYRGYF